MSNEVKIPITLPGAAQAAADAGKVSAGLQGISNAAKQGGEAANEQAKGAAAAGKEIISLGETTEKANQIGRTMAEVARGNYLALLNLTGILKATGAALKTNIIGLAALAVTAIGSFVLSLRSTAKGAEEAKPQVDAFGDALGKVSKVKLDDLANTLAAIKENAKGAADQLERVLALTESVNKAKTASARADIEANPNLTPEEKKRRLGEIEQKAVNEARALEDQKLGEKYLAAKSTAEQTRAAATAIEAERAQAESRAKQAEERKAALAEERRALEIENANLGQATGGTPAERASRGRRQVEITDRVRELKKQEEAASSPEAQRYIDAQKKRAEELSPAAKKAAEEAAAAEEAFRKVGEGVVGIIPRTGAAIREPSVAFARGLEDRARRRSAGIPEAESRQSSPATVTGGEIKIAGSNGEDIAAKITQTVQARIRAGEEAIANAVAKRMAAQEAELDRIRGIIQRGPRQGF